LIKAVADYVTYLFAISQLLETEQAINKSLMIYMLSNYVVLQAQQHVFFFEMANDVNPAWFILARLWFACFIRDILSLKLAVN
jgi:hypothetical protein